VYDVVTEHFATNRVSDATYKRAIATLGEQGLVDLVGTVGYYSLVSITLNVFQMELPPGEKAPLAAPRAKAAPRRVPARKKAAKGKTPARRR
jgi:4-carboxymuconolactone decarboxylase